MRCRRRRGTRASPGTRRSPSCTATKPVPYDQQPYLAESAAAADESGGPYLVYLDVWEREVTQFEAPDLVDKAVGVDSTTRLQTVWQVKTLGNDAGTGIDCSTDLTTLPDWTALTAPSAGRLRTATATFGTTDPCLIPPAGGYTGLENQLYRVEIHDAGAPGKATFKWSRDNASVETRVDAFPDASTLIVESVGKDGVLRFNDGDWIEILDDWLELAGGPGELHRIVLGGGVDDATRTITLETPVTPGRFNADPAAGRHTRIRRWDQKGQVLRTDTSPPSVYTDLGSAASPGTIFVPDNGSVTLALESGIVVAFDLFVAGGLFLQRRLGGCSRRAIPPTPRSNAARPPARRAACITTTPSSASTRRRASRCSTAPSSGRPRSAATAAPARSASAPRRTRSRRLRCSRRSPP